MVFNQPRGSVSGLPRHSGGTLTAFAMRKSRKSLGLRLLQLRILLLGLLQDREVGVSVFPQREEILVSNAALRGVALKGVSASQAKMSQHAHRTPEIPARCQRDQ